MCVCVSVTLFILQSHGDVESSYSVWTKTKFSLKNLLWLDFFLCVCVRMVQIVLVVLMFKTTNALVQIQSQVLSHSFTLTHTLRSLLFGGRRGTEHVIHIPSMWWINTLILCG